MYCSRTRDLVTVEQSEFEALKGETFRVEPSPKLDRFQNRRVAFPGERVRWGTLGRDKQQRYSLKLHEHGLDNVLFLNSHPKGSVLQGWPQSQVTLTSSSLDLVTPQRRPSGKVPMRFSRRAHHHTSTATLGSEPDRTDSLCLLLLRT